MKQPLITGRCYCGKIRYRASGPPKFQGNCHCENCRRASGAQAVAWISVEKKTFRYVRGQPKRYRTPTKAWRTFCPACGTSLTYESSKRLTDIDLITGTLTHPKKFPPKRDYFAEEKLPWVDKLRQRRR